MGPDCADPTDVEHEPGTAATDQTAGSSYENDPAADEIRGQVEYYFSDPNLVSDDHLLTLSGGSQNLPVALKEICRWRKMRPFKPIARVRAALESSTHLVVTNPNHVQRRVPLSMASQSSAEPRSKPKSKSSRHTSSALDCKKQVLVDKPWLTKGLLRPTGFEPNYADAPMTPKDHADNLECYRPDFPFESRIETAIQRYRARRKLHQQNQNILSQFLSFGGIETGPKQFNGGMSKEEMEDKSALEIAVMNATDRVPAHLLDTNKWSPDFAGVAMGFLSSTRIYELDLCGPEDVLAVTNVIQNFYRYLLYHEVCPEYKDNLMAAQDICLLANTEVVKALEVTIAMPDGFSSACSVLFNGRYAGIYGSHYDWEGAENLGWNVKQAETIFMAAIAACGTDEQFAAVDRLMESTGRVVGNTGSALSHRETTSIRQVTLQVIEVILPDDDTKSFYDNKTIHDSFLQPLGRLSFRHLTPDLAHPIDDDTRASIWMEQRVLAHCFIGMKLEGEIREIRLGDETITWLDTVRAVNASFHLILPNETFDSKTMGVLPREYLKRLRTILVNGWRTQDEMAAALVDDDLVDGDDADADAGVGTGTGTSGAEQAQDQQSEAAAVRLSVSEWNEDAGPVNWNETAT